MYNFYLYSCVFLLSDCWIFFSFLLRNRKHLMCTTCGKAQHQRYVVVNDQESDYRATGAE